MQKSVGFFFLFKKKRVLFKFKKKIPNNKTIKSNLFMLK